MDEYKGVLQEIVSIKNNFSGYNNIPIWAGESSTAFDTGAQNMTNTFLNGFLWLDNLGLSALNKVAVVIRQSFWGFAYSVINDQGIPNPV
jgi:heparanase